jgi:Flp pilus assembly pilin Flp
MIEPSNPLLEVQMNETINKFINDESGQGITEYGAILAFVAVLVAVVFAAIGGGLQPAISKAFSAVASQLNQLSTSAGTAS